MTEKKDNETISGNDLDELVQEIDKVIDCFEKAVDIMTGILKSPFTDPNAPVWRGWNARPLIYEIAKAWWTANESYENADILKQRVLIERLSLSERESDTTDNENDTEQ